MAVLTLAGKPINWAKPPKPTDRVVWSQKTTGGKTVTGSLRTIAHLDRLNSLAVKKFGVGIIIYQGPYNTTVAASAGTHDLDACLDVWIPGIDGYVQQAFFRANGAGAYYRTPAQGFTPHIHYFTLPPRAGADVAQGYQRGGFKVGLYVDGGWSTRNARVSSAQIEDYYEHKSALSGHLPDSTWFPTVIDTTIFDLDAYIVRKRIEKPVAKKVRRNRIVVINSHGPLARLGSEGPRLWAQWETNMRKRHDHYVDDLRIMAFTTSDTNKHGALPNFGKGFRRIGGKGIDLIGRRVVANGVTYKVLARKAVDLHIDGHDAYGVKVKVTFPNKMTATFWTVQANLGRSKTDAQFRTAAVSLKKAFGKQAIYNFDEIDEGDVPDEHRILREVFPSKDFTASGWSTLCPTLVGPMLRVVRTNIAEGCPGKAKVTPARKIVETVLAHPKD